MRFRDFVAFIKARDAVRVAKEAEKPRPWTKDPILSKYRFCNVRRDDDAVTKWLRTMWYPHWDEEPMSNKEMDPDIWFAAVVARLFNNPDALNAIRGCVIPFKPERMRQILHDRKKAGLKNFNAAYIVSTNGRPMDKVDYIVRFVLGPMWIDRKKLRYDYETLDSYHELLMGYDGMGSFIAAQVIADLKSYGAFSCASDRTIFVASGPGSRRGLNRVIGRSSDSPWREHEFRQCLWELRDKTLPLLPVPIHALDAQDIQNCLCEFDKYERARLGEGTPKQIYKEK